MSEGRSSIAIDISVASDAWSLEKIEDRIGTAIDTAIRVSRARLEDGAELSVLLCDDAFIRGLNRQWRGQDKPTNVLSFPAATTFTPALGDIAIAYETTAQEAAAEGKSLSDHFIHLLIHGFLHLIGYDHRDEAEAAVMEKLEREVLAELGIADPYARFETA
ncbi:MAG TPA: rRNA maturation RNase YbeY [Methylovirgula sp.]|nr:rRNA maturation RNase YbeY [Methylovirgula sp.]